MNSLRPAVLVLAAAALACAATAAPQRAGGTVTNIRVGQTVRGELTTSDPKLDDDSHYDTYRITGEAGNRIRIRMESDDFDTFLAFLDGTDPLGVPVAANDDSGSTTNSALIATLSGQPQLIRANSLEGDVTGSYTLRVEDLGPAPEVTSQGDIRPGQTVRGELSEDDPVEADSSYFDLWTIRGQPNQNVIVTMSSDDFDTYLAVGEQDGQAWTQASANDDDASGESGTNSRLETRLGPDGVLHVHANSLSAGDTGRYALAVQAGGSGTDAGNSEPTPRPNPTVTPRDPPSVANIRIDGRVAGTLESSDGLMDDGTLYDAYAFSGRSGQTVRITMRSEAFDTFLLVGRGRGADFNALAFDDDAGGGTDSRIEVELPEAGIYIVRANAVFAEGTGAYTLEVEEVEGGSAPPGKRN